VHLHIEDWLAGVQRSSRQKKPLKMQNKPNLLSAKMNINSAITKDYEYERLGRRAKTNPNPSSMRDTKNEKQSQISKEEMNITSATTKDYKNETSSHPTKTNPTQSKPNRRYRLPQFKIQHSKFEIISQGTQSTTHQSATFSHLLQLFQTFCSAVQRLVTCFPEFLQFFTNFCPFFLLNPCAND
jgi:hypothetical protein